MEQEIFQNRVDLTEIKEALDAVRSNIQKVVIGQDKLIDYLIVAILSGGHVLIEGVPGVAKTLSAKLLARTIAADFSRIQFTPDLMPSDVLGTSVFNQAKNAFEFVQGPVFSNIVLIDEINRAPAKTQAALFEVMEEHQVSVDGTTYPMGQPFMVLATQNPVEHEGTYSLPEAQLDRFLFRINVDYPSAENEFQILKNNHAYEGVPETQKIDATLTPEQISKFQKIVASVTVEDQIFTYIVDIVQKLRNSPAIYLGPSPRASIAIMNSAKSWALLQNRDFVIPDDVKSVCEPVLNHRLILTPEKEMEGIKTSDVIGLAIDKVEVPR